MCCSINKNIHFFFHCKSPLGYLLSAVAPAMFGFVHDLTHSWNLPLLILMALSLVQLIVGFGAGRNVLVTQIEEQRKVV
jgi:CP family cyanate transporter-like MFS transporter